MLCDINGACLLQLPDLPAAACVTDSQRMQVTGSPSTSGEVLWGTAAAQLEILKRQHTDDCKNAKFFVHKSQDGGIGSLVHQVRQAALHNFDDRSSAG